MAGIEIACNYLVQHRRDMLSACWRKLLILVASPAGFEPATCGLEIGRRALIFQEKYGLCCVVAACQRSHLVALVCILWRNQCPSASVAGRTTTAPEVNPGSSTTSTRPA